MYPEGKKMKQFIFGLITALLASLNLFDTSVAGQEPLGFNLSMDKINISTFYNGTTIDVTGALPANEDVVLQVSGAKKDVHLKEKGKIAGFLWMNKTSVSLENTPVVYMVYTPAGPTSHYLNPELGLGYKALVKDISIAPKSKDKAYIFGEYVKLMEKSGVYAVHEGSIHYSEPKNGVKIFKATLSIPSEMSAGTYGVEAITIKDSSITNRIRKDLKLELTGLPAMISSIAFDRPLLFGFLAVIIAIIAGMFMSYIFRGGDGGAH